MQTTPRNKQVTTEHTKTRELPERDFMFPRAGKTIRAKTRKEAEAKLKGNTHAV
jgi:hypothetical protein